VNVYDRESGKRYDHELYHRPLDGGYCFDLLFGNRTRKRAGVSWEIEGVEDLPPGLVAKVYDPADGSLRDASEMQHVRLSAESSTLRKLLVGRAGYHEGFVADLRPLKFALLDVSPNPFRRGVQIRFTVPRRGVERMVCTVVDPRGREVWRRELGEQLTAGLNAVWWNGTTTEGEALSSGMYVVRITALDERDQRVRSRRIRVMLMRH
jgi:hypothetical protein